MTVWGWSYGPWFEGPASDVGPATSRSVTWRLTGRHEASYTINGRVPQALAFTELVTDLWITRNGFCLFRGRLGSVSDDINQNTHTATVNFADYRAVLDRRLLYDDDPFSYLSADQADIAWGLISTTQAHPGGDLSIIRGIGSITTVNRTRIIYDVSAKIGESIDNLAKLQNGFDWDITPNANARDHHLTLDIWHPYRGNDRGVTLDYGGLAVTVSRSVDPGSYANAIRSGGANSITAVHLEVPDIASRPEGRWDGTADDSDLASTADVTAAATQALADASTLIPSYTVTMRSGAWRGPDHIWLGDLVRLRLTSGRLAVDTIYRVQEIQATWSDSTDHDPSIVDSDGVTVAATLGAIPPDRRWRLREFDNRLTSLERR